MIRIGIAGIGFTGMVHYLAAGKLQGASVTAVHSRDANNFAGDGPASKETSVPPAR